MNDLIMKETEPLKQICDMLTSCLKSHLENGIQNADTQETLAVVDMIHKLAESKKNTAKAIYYAQITKAMEESKYGEDDDEEGPRYYRGRSARTGRYVHRPFTVPREGGYNVRMMPKEAYYQDYEEGRRNYEEGRMHGYEEGRMHGYDEGRMDGRMHSREDSRYERSKRGYEEAHKKSAKEGTEDAREAKMQSLNEYLGTIGEELGDKIMKMDQQEKSVTRNALQTIQNKII